MHSVYFSSQPLVSALFIAVPTNAQKFSWDTCLYTFLVMQLYSYAHTIEKHAMFICIGRMAMIWWLDYKYNLKVYLITHFSLLITNCETITYLEMHNC